ncbi:hypothetical protein [Devosia sp.]|uniref:hypothetical protein n=1 Tax=Devosia sp. TaxID=1871048 RepID=UPI002736FD41|nr:hypothetical protein [Devosia sp.]MDP2780619.1 hypothetical protein [Devosia sp.]
MRVHLGEVIGGQPAEHVIDLRLLVVTNTGDDAARIREIVLTKTAKVLSRLKNAFEMADGSAWTEELTNKSG